MAKPKYKINGKAVKEILNRAEVQNDLLDIAQAIAAELGDPYVAEVYDYSEKGRNRKVAVVKDPSEEALQREANTGALAKAARRQR